MTRFLFLSFAFLGWAFFEVSGGAEFEPETPERIAKFEAEQVQRDIVAKEAEWARKTATAEKARLSEAERASMQLASLDFSAAPTVSDPSGTPPPLTRRATLFSQPVATPEADRADLSPSEEELQVATLLIKPEPADIRSVRGSRVNMRGGPGTGYAVLGTLIRGDEVKVLKEPGNGWVKLKVIDNGRVGWMSAKLLKKVE